MQNTGWSFWINDNDAVRLLMVGTADFHEAEKIAKGLAPSGEIVAYEEITPTIMDFLVLSERVIEMFALQGSKNKPRGITRGGKFGTKAAA